MVGIGRGALGDFYDLETVTLPADEAARRVYTTYGRETADGAWRDLSAPDAAAWARCRFFKVGVRMK